MTPEFVLRVGKAIASLFRNDKRRHRILIGRDTCLSDPMIEDALVAGICSIKGRGEKDKDRTVEFHIVWCYSINQFILLYLPFV